MSSIRVGKRRSYTHVWDDQLPADGSLSARAWGIYVYLIGRPPGWETSTHHLAKVFREGRDAIRTALHELVAAGLMVMEESRIGNLPVTRFAIPDEVQESGFQTSEKPSLVTTDLVSDSAPGRVADPKDRARTPLRRHVRAPR